MPIAITDEQLALQFSIREWAKRTGAIEVVRGLEPRGRNPAREGIATTAGSGPAAERWCGLAELGLFGIGLPSALGGAGGSTSDLAAALAQLTESLGPGPVLPTLLARLLLAASPQLPAARTYLPLLSTGSVSVAAALDAGTVSGAARPDGSVLLTGRCGPVLGGGSTTHLLIGTTSGQLFLLPADAPGISIAERPPADFSRSLADVSFREVVAVPGQLLASDAREQMGDLAAVLFAVEAAATASWCSRTAADYAALRQQFGRPIGSFQAVKHLCAGMLCRAESASVLAWDAARAIEQAPDELPLAAAAAAACALDAAVDNAKECIQVLGGIGFTWEHDAHLYLRRALALRHLLGGSRRWRDRAAGLGLTGARRQLAVAADDSHLAGELAEARTAVRARAADWIGLPAAGQRLAMADAGYAAPGWPAPYGLGASAAARIVIDAELAAAGLSRPDIGIGGWAVPAILSHGSQAQKDRFAGPTLRGEISWCQLFSEPEAGSDLASVRTRAEPAGGGWVLTGQKVWTSLARDADWGICLARTDSTVPRHKGLTFFLVAMNSPGIEVRPLREITGRQMFNQVFLDGVHVPEACVVGAPGDGWRVARTTLASERVAMGAGSSVGQAVEDLLRLADRTGVASDPVTRQRLGALIAQGMAVSLLDLQAALAQLRGTDPGALAAVSKLVGVAHRQEVAEVALDLSGSDGAAADSDGGALLAEFLLTRCLSIAGGTTQILLSLVAERQLGLPREEAR